MITPGWQNREDAPAPDTSNSWIVTFTDLVSLMLTFFVMMFAMSNVKVDQWKNMTDALSRSLNPLKLKSVVTPSAQFNIGSLFRKPAINLDYLASILREAVSRDSSLAGTRLIKQEDRLIIALPGNALFVDGRAQLTEPARDALFSLGGVLRTIANQMAVYANAETGRPADAAYDTGWELSLARAINVANTLRDSGHAEGIAAHGFADSRYADLTGLSDEERRQLARRVDIVVLPYTGDL
jgi:chemotaxis protein MotB